MVSRCGPETERRTLLWMEHSSFHDLTGIPRERVHFVRERRDKAPVCEELGVTHFVDDRLEVLGYLAESGVGNLYLFRGRDAEIEANRRYLERVNAIGGWPALEKALQPCGRR